MAYQISDGATLERSTDGTTWASVPQVRAITPPVVEAEFASVRNLGSAGANKQQWTGYGASSGSAEIDVDMDNATHISILADSFDGTNPSSRYWRVTYPNTGASVVAWQGVVKCAPNAQTGQWVNASLSWVVLDPSTISWTD